LNFRKLAVAAIKEEVKGKEDNKIFICNRLMTYAELAQLAEQGDEEVKKFFLDPYVKKLKTVPEFRLQVLAMLGLSNS